MSGPIPVGMSVLHRCDNPPCCNVEHLFLGTTGDNVRDCVSKGRHNPSRGEANGSAKLTTAKVSEIRLRYAAGERPQRMLAAEYGVSKGLISAVLTGRRWSA